MQNKMSDIRQKWLNFVELLVENCLYLKPRSKISENCLN